MDEKYEKLHSYGKSLTQDLQAVQDHLYQALCQSEAEKAVEAKRFKEEISRLKQQLVAQRTDSERKIQRTRKEGCQDTDSRSGSSDCCLKE